MRYRFKYPLKGVYGGLYWDNGRENENYYLGFT